LATTIFVSRVNGTFRAGISTERMTASGRRTVAHPPTANAS
jgi:hypothetical protein